MKQFGRKYNNALKEVNITNISYIHIYFTLFLRLFDQYNVLFRGMYLFKPWYSASLIIHVLRRCYHVCLYVCSCYGVFRKCNIQIYIFIMTCCTIVLRVFIHSTDTFRHIALFITYRHNTHVYAYTKNLQKYVYFVFTHSNKTYTTENPICLL